MSSDIGAKLQQAVALHQRGRLDDAEALYRTVLTAAPSNFDALHLLGIVHYQRGEHDAALPLLERAVSVGPNDVFAHYNHGLVLQALKRPAEALFSYENAARLKPDYAEAHVNRANVLRDLKRPDEALRSYDLALQLKPDFVEALNNKAATLLDLKHAQEALVLSDRVLQLRPDYTFAHINRASALDQLKRYAEALESYDRALALDPQSAVAYDLRGNLRAREFLRFEEAAADFEQVLRIDSEHSYARGHLLHMRMHCCDWRDFAVLSRTVKDGIADRKRVCWPFAVQAISESPAELKACSETYASHVYPARTPVWTGERYKHDRIRLGYVSGELREQATSYLTARLFELHDRDRFEVHAFDNGFDDGGPMRQRLNAAFDSITAISGLDDLAAARAMREREIDILINLNGYFGRERSGVFAHRPAPIQVNYLGFPATLGAQWMDYIIADRIVIPDDERRHYSEKVVQLPDAYQVNDDKRRAADRMPTREEAGLPERGFVFCSFNNSYKYTPAIFDVWMRLLGGVEESVLWLFESNMAMARNLKREAEARGIAAGRLIFAPFIKYEDHLARLKLADLFLDSLPYNAHTTASDALWMGVSVVTCAGSTFPGRVAASLLDAVGLPELVTHNLSEYEALALKLVRNPAALSAIKKRLAENRISAPLFDTDRYRRHLENAFVTMWERQQRGAAPESFAVQAIE